MLLVGIEDLLRAIAVMNVEIDDGDALDAMLGASIGRSDGNIVEQTKAHNAVAFGVVAGRAYLAERVGDARHRIHHSIDSEKAGAGRPAYRLPRAG